MRRPAPRTPRPERRPPPIGDRVRRITDLIDEAIGPVPETEESE